MREWNGCTGKMVSLEPGSLLLHVKLILCAEDKMEGESLEDLGHVLDIDDCL